jgi:hypothetical protein
MNTVEDTMLEHYRYIIDVKQEELNTLLNDVEYKQQELAQLVDTLDKMKIILDTK